jgi:hypothetical protein
MDSCDLHEEPPIPVIPDSPEDPTRIPLLPNDLAPDAVPDQEESDKKFSPLYFFRHRLFGRSAHEPS